MIEAVDGEDDDAADDGQDPGPQREEAAALDAEEAADPAADERADDAEDEGDDPSHRVIAREDGLGDCAGDETDDDQTDPVGVECQRHEKRSSHDSRLGQQCVSTNISGGCWVTIW